MTSRPFPSGKHGSSWNVIPFFKWHVSTTRPSASVSFSGIAVSMPGMTSKGSVFHGSYSISVSYTGSITMRLAVS